VLQVNDMLFTKKRFLRVQNVAMFHGVIQKITLAQFFWDTVYIRVRLGLS